jgi:hypothetical protein
MTFTYAQVKALVGSGFSNETLRKEDASISETLVKKMTKAMTNKVFATKNLQVDADWNSERKKKDAVEHIMKDLIKDETFIKARQVAHAKAHDKSLQSQTTAVSSFNFKDITRLVKEVKEEYTSSPVATVSQGQDDLTKIKEDLKNMKLLMEENAEKFKMMMKEMKQM